MCRYESEHEPVAVSVRLTSFACIGFRDPLEINLVPLLLPFSEAEKKVPPHICMKIVLMCIKAVASFMMPPAPPEKGRNADLKVCDPFFPLHIHQWLPNYTDIVFEGCSFNDALLFAYKVPFEVRQEARKSRADVRSIWFYGQPCCSAAHVDESYQNCEAAMATLKCLSHLTKAL